MDPGFRSLLYREPHLYDLVFPDADNSLGRMCREAFRRYLPAPPRSALDIGCGSGQFLASLAETVDDCWGVDLLEEHVAYAAARHPRLRVVQGDMRDVRLDRAFALITSFGNALSYALTDLDLARTAATWAAHATRGTLLIADVLNARSYLDGDGFRERIEGCVDVPGFRAASVSTHTLDRAARRLTRTRVWRIAGQADPVVDWAEYRLVFPDELTRLCEAAGFQVCGLFDNRELRPTELAGRAGAGPDVGGLRGRKLYVFARYAGGEATPCPG